MLLLLAIPSLSLLFLQNRQVQTRVSMLLTERLSEELGARITLSSVNYSFFKRVQVRDLYIEDLHGDTLLYSELTKLRIKQLRSDKNGAEIRKVVLENTWVNLVIDSSNVVNLSFITSQLKKPHVPPERKNRLHIEEITMHNGRFTLSRMKHPPIRSMIDFNDFDLRGLEIEVEDLISVMDTVSMNVISIQGVEQSGFEFSRITTLMTVGKTHLHFRDLEVNTRESELHVPTLGFEFKHWKTFKHFSREVDLNFESNNSSLNMEDLSAFVPQTRGLFRQLSIDGGIHGKLNDLKGRDLLMTFDQNSSLAFDFLMIGLPDIRNTFIDIRFRELNSSVSAIHQLITKTNQTTGETLKPWGSLGKLDFKGHFTGYPDNFVATGALGTDLGRMVMDLSFQPDGSRGIAFEGHLSAGNFMLGNFLDQQELLSQLDMDVMVDGHLFEGNIKADLNGTIDTLDFSNYAYSNITLDGAFTNTTFNGGFSINDPNLRLDFDGKMDYSGEVPAYNFTADVARSRPHYLNLGVKDPNTFASFLIKTDIRGNTVDALNGEVRLINSLFEREGVQLQLYGASLTALNTNDTSALVLLSDQLDASMTGRFKLSSLPSAFRNLADLYVNLVPDRDPSRRPCSA